ADAADQRGGFLPASAWGWTVGRARRGVAVQVAVQTAHTPLGVVHPSQKVTGAPNSWGWRLPWKRMYCRAQGTYWVMIASVRWWARRASARRSRRRGAAAGAGAAGRPSDE